MRSAAKINLHLGVGAPRDDGFHPLDTVYQAVSLYDDLTASRADDWSVTTRTAVHLGDVALPGPGDNIVDRVAELLCATRCDEGCRPTARVEIDKTIPVAGGMAGGSADAAAALVALDRLWDLRTPDDALLDLAAQLGSDVPFALVGGTAHGLGRGEVVTAVEDHGSWAWVVVPDTGGLSTPAVYRHWDTLFPDAPATPAPAQPVLTALASGDPMALAAALRNDLEAAAVDLRPDLGELIARGEAEGALRGMVSGSGPTCVFLCESPEAARDVATALSATRDVVLTAHGPVAGAHLLG
ncbi:4-(cytidine 5'-diphospho)-2-C-methyl-D-erythritol kinase [Nocardioides sp. Y6]|uniref:4-diphosphocytidyl-2-C-methyl-D-erythritol kinase n=1 Tax=Nocardioides malaquae TaxID=2773426 RepID=A0ABR9RUU2_9ACTN|nr:4-(cytidine 5'-diphospho)-2-C-methyl-D-erythritol kinase [Nocardioides malaquae]